MSLYYPSITSDNRTESFELQVARGLVPGHRVINIFGFNPDVDTAQETVWPQGGILTFPSTAIKMKVSSSSTNDAAAGTGARTVMLMGLDSLYREIREVVTLNGQTAVETTQNFLRVNCATVVTTGSGNSAAGTIYIGTGDVTTGVPATVYQVITVGDNNSICGHFCVPAGHTAFILKGLLSTGQVTGNNQVTGRLMTMNSDNIKRTLAITSITAGSGVYEFIAPPAVPEKTDIETTAVATSNNHIVSSFLNMILVAGEPASGFGIPRY
jgi:hypothetical protein